MTDRTLRISARLAEEIRQWASDELGMWPRDTAYAADLESLLAQIAAAQPAPDAVADAAIADDDSLAKRISELGWQIHNLGCEYQNDEKLLDRLQDLRGMAWEIADTVREGAA